MLFNSLDFLFFFPVVVLAYYVIPKRLRYIWLLVCSYYFYMMWNPKYVLLILTSTIVTYLGSLMTGSKKAALRTNFEKEIILLIVLCINLGILIYFKYSNFFLDGLGKIAAAAGLSFKIPRVDVLLPVGISFYTFQALSYSIDVYRGDIEPEKNFIKYALFVSFFPQLVAGPIERSKNLLAQIQKIHEIRFHFRFAYRGLLFMIWGLFLKMVIADRIAILVDTVFDKYYLYGGIELIAGAVAFAIQIYCDFLSYSIIAFGAAQVLGLTLMENFDAPYFSGSIKEFWRRWHISLSTWFKDYVYIPLGGSRVGRIRKYFNYMVVFLLSGLWHGAARTYVVWGGIHGIYRVFGDWSEAFRERLRSFLKIKTDCFSYKAWRVLVTFLLTDFAWIFFRSPGIHSALSYIKRIFVDFDPWALSNGAFYSLGLDQMEMSILLVSLAVLFFSDAVKFFRNKMFVDWIMEQNVLFQYAAALFFIFAVLIFGVYGPAFDAKAFIYFQF